MLTVRFTDFWKTPERQIDSFFLPLIETIFESPAERVYATNTKVDLEFFSVFRKKGNFGEKISNRIKNFSAPPGPSPSNSPREYARKTIWYSGENKRPPLTVSHDSYLGFEPEGILENIHYLPIWVLNFDWFGRGSAHGFTPTTLNLQELLKPRRFDPATFADKKFCCAFIGNPASYRLGLINELSSIGQTDIFGRYTGNLVESKATVAQNYRFSFAFENDISPGYVTEKLLESYVTGNIPLYWGLDSQEYFNSQSYINLSSFRDFSEFQDEVIKANTFIDYFEEIYQQPLFKREFDLNGVIDKLRRELL
jgi:hypothetical protein